MAVLQEYKCPCCGGAIEFNSGIQKMKCPYCDTEFEMESLVHVDEELDTAAPQAEPEWVEGDTDGMRIYVCKSCGGEIVGDENTAATSCPFCGNPIVMMGNFSGELKPDLIIPFKLDKNAAKASLQQHLTGKKLLPKIFKDENHIDEIKGVYVPFWLYDADVDADMTYRATKVRRWSDSRFNYKETSYFDVRRAGSIGFDDVPVKGTTKMASDLMESIEPFDLSQALDFQTAYLAGYVADKYDISAEESEERANERIKTSVESAFTETLREYDSHRLEGSNLQFHAQKPSYALYPVWLLNTTWNGEKYTFAMNGQTGKFVGNLPVDKGAYWRWFAIIGGIAAVLTYGIGLLVNLM